MSRHESVDNLLLNGAESLDITVGTYRQIEANYNDVASFLAEFWRLEAVEGTVYLQGSVPLGTVTRQIHRGNEVDVDLVVVRFLTKNDTTKAGLKSDLGDGLKQYIGTGPASEPELSEGKRCWTLTYDGMHLDALPALPNPESSTGILITDKSMLHWQYSDPVAYRQWFFDRMAPQLEQASRLFAKRVDVEQIPEPMIKTTLQQAIQLLKRHRDCYFTRNLADRPASIIITTLAAMAYSGGESLMEVLEHLTTWMSTYVEHESGIFVLRNPVEKKENFADRWNRHPRRAQMFYDWIERAALDFSNIARANGVHGAIQKMSDVLGAGTANYAAEQFGRGRYEARLAGLLNYQGGTGILTTDPGASARLVRPAHTFHGDSAARP